MATINSDINADMSSDISSEIKSADSKHRLEKFVAHQKDEPADSEEVFFDLIRVLVVMLVVFAIIYGIWFS